MTYKKYKEILAKHSENYRLYNTLREEVGFRCQIHHTDVLAAMVETVDTEKIEWEKSVRQEIINLIEQLASKDKVITELKKQILNILRKETGFDKELCLNALIESNYDLNLAKSIAITTHPKF